MEKLKKGVKLLGEAKKRSSFLEKLKRFKLPQEAKKRFKRVKLPQEKVSARKSGRLIRNSGRPPQHTAARPSIVPTGHHQWPVARKQGRWPQAMAGEVWGWPTSYFPPSEAKQQVFGAKLDTKQSSREILRLGA